MSIMNPNWKLPDDIAKVIFSKLPFFNLPNCRIVCKAWNRLVLDYAFSSKFLSHPNAFLVCSYDVAPNPRPGSYYTCNPKIHCFDFDTLNSVASLAFAVDSDFIAIFTSCNGLLLITKSINNDIVGTFGILNPMTKELIQLSTYGCDDFYSFGFGFCPETNKFKLFRIMMPDKLISAIEVWRFGTADELEQWKPLCSRPFSIHCHAIYQDGVIYWIGKDMQNDFVIYGLDVETEVFETIAVLDVGLGPYSYKCHVYFRSFNGTIYLIINIPAPVLKMQVWIMKAKHSWVKEFVIGLSNDDRFCQFIKADEGGLFFQVNNDLFYFDNTGKKIKIKTLFNPNVTKFRTVWHIESFHFGSLSKILAGNN